MSGVNSGNSQSDPAAQCMALQSVTVWGDAGIDPLFTELRMGTAVPG